MFRFAWHWGVWENGYEKVMIGTKGEGEVEGLCDFEISV